MVEFKYDGVANETFFKDQTIPRSMFYKMKTDFFPKVYFSLVPKGKWYGSKFIFKPTFK